MTRIEKLEQRRIDKSWGYEQWIHNNDEYCGKLLVFTVEGGHTSMHFHALKRETMHCAMGRFAIDFIDMETGAEYTVSLLSGDAVEIPRYQLHRIRSLELCSVLYEFGTPHRDDDSYRSSPSFQKKEG